MLHFSTTEVKMGEHSLVQRGNRQRPHRNLRAGGVEAFSMHPPPLKLGNPKIPLLTQSRWKLEAGNSEPGKVAGELWQDAVEEADANVEREDVQEENRIPAGPN